MVFYDFIISQFFLNLDNFLCNLILLLLATLLLLRYKNLIF